MTTGTRLIQAYDSLNRSSGKIARLTPNECMMVLKPRAGLAELGLYYTKCNIQGLAIPEKAFSIDRDDESISKLRNGREYRVYIELAISSLFVPIISHFTCNNSSVRGISTQLL